jgi:hypothetical protein
MKNIQPLVVVSVMIFLISVLFIELSHFVISRAEEWQSVSAIESFLQIELPQDAQDVKYSGYTHRGIRIELSFKTSGAGSSQFSSSICDGSLWRGYDPFDAIDIGEPFTYTFPITSTTGVYYSYSPDPSASVFGIRCFNRGLYQLRKLQLNADEYEILFTYETGCPETAPCYRIPPRSINPVEAPIDVLGFVQENGNYVLIAPEVCLSIERPVFVNMDWTHLYGSFIEVSFNNQRIASAWLTSEGTFYPRYDSLDNPVSLSPSEDEYSYCFPVNATMGHYEMSLNITLVSGDHISSTWEFTSEDGFPVLSH